MAYGDVEPTIAGPLAFAVLAIVWIGLLGFSYQALFVRDWFGNHFIWKWAVLTGLAFYVLSGAAVLGGLAQQSVGDGSWYGETVMWVGYGAFFIRVVGCLICFVVLCKLSKPADAIAD